MSGPDGSCILWDEILDDKALSKRAKPPKDIDARREWLVAHHTGDPGQCDWCLLTAEIRRLRDSK